MTSKLITSALCLILCPLLAAQQVDQAEARRNRVQTAEMVFAYRNSARADNSLSSANSSGSPYELSTIPFQTPVALTPVDPAAWADATIGSTLTFRVVNSVIVRGKADICAGTLIDAKVIRIRKGKLRARHGRTELRVKEVLVGKSIKLELESFPERPAGFVGTAKNLVVLPLQIILAFPVWIILMIACNKEC